MPIFSVKRHPDGVMNDFLVLAGTPDEINPTEGDFIAGFTITGAKSGGQHDGHPAHIITLADDMGAREIGRLIVRTDVPVYKEECLEWERQFESPEEADRFLLEWSDRDVVYVSSQDFAYNEATVELGIATVSAKFGISIEVVEDHGPGGGWPVVRLTGLRPNLRRALLEAWAYTEPDVDTEMKRVS